MTVLQRRSPGNRQRRVDEGAGIVVAGDGEIRAGIAAAFGAAGAESEAPAQEAARRADNIAHCRCRAVDDEGTRSGESRVAQDDERPADTDVGKGSIGLRRPISC